MKPEYRTKVLNVVESSNIRVGYLERLLKGEIRSNNPSGDALTIINEIKRNLQTIEDVVSLS
jgi:hypothetical protein